VTVRRVSRSGAEDTGEPHAEQNLEVLASPAPHSAHARLFEGVPLPMPRW
jgi:hypothetical protein